MKVKYFKNYDSSTDCYVGEEENKGFDFFNIVSISKDYFSLCANDEGSSFEDGRLNGLYRFLDVHKKDFMELQDLAISSDREKGVTLLKKIHRENSDKDPNLAIVEGNMEDYDLERIMKEYEEVKPILE